VIALGPLQPRPTADHPEAGGPDVPAPTTTKQAQQPEDQAARTFELANEADQLAQHARHNARHLQRV